MAGDVKLILSLSFQMSIVALFNSGLQTKLGSNVAEPSYVWNMHHPTYLPHSSPRTGDNNTVVYLEEVPLQAFPMFQGTTKHFCYI